MMVTAIVDLDRRRRRVLLDRETELILYPADLRQYHIEEGEDLPEESYRQILETVLKPRAWERTLRSLQVSDKTKEELRRLLRRDGYPEEAIQDAVARAEQYHYIDDEAYAMRYLECKSGKKSRRQIRQKMQEKGFPKELVDTLLEEHPVDEREQILKLLEKKGFHPGDELDEKSYSRSAGMLARKGYPYAIITEILGRPKAFID